MTTKKTHIKGRQPLPWHLLMPKYWYLWLGIFTLSLMSYLPARLRDPLGRRIGTLIFNKNQKRRTIAYQNLALCYPQYDEHTLLELTQQHFQHFYSALLTLPRYWWARPESLKKQTAMIGYEHITEAQQAGKGIILMGCHTATLEVGGLMLSMDHPSLAYYHEFKNPLLEWWMIRCRTRFGGRVISRKHNLSDTVRQVRKGALLNYLGDEDLGSDNATFAAFMGVTKATQTGLTKLARLCRADVIPCFNYYDVQRKKHISLILPPLQNFPSGDDATDALTINDCLAKMIQHAPTQYMWTMKLFKTQPDSQKSVYR
ncbi:MAG: hypothetical protein MJA28_08010 [Gammaproteobacteria bacterium]|nr:hypothetical protein [Gammaproteobacteria bacterium]